MKVFEGLYTKDVRSKRKNWDECTVTFNPVVGDPFLYHAVVKDSDGEVLIGTSYKAESQGPDYGDELILGSFLVILEWEVNEKSIQSLSQTNRVYADMVRPIEKIIEFFAIKK